MLKAVVINIADIYVPAARRKELDPQKIDLVAEKIMDAPDGQPIQVRRGNDRYVLVKGINRLEACKALGEETIYAFIVAAQQH